MKLLTITVPCYNSAAYMEKCVDSLLVGGEDVEILIVNDGSTKDNTAEIADRYAEKYPTIVRAIHQENKGHGGAVNTGLANATGLFFKVVDSDDWLNEEAFKRVLKVLEASARGPETLDMLICNYVYEKEGVAHKRVMKYTKSLPQDRMFGWDEVKPLGKSHYLLMHSLIHRTELLRECGLILPEHTFYVDNLVAFVPIPYVRNMYYLDANLYRYFIGRTDQSVNETVMIGRLDQQLRVNKMLIDSLAGQKELKKMQKVYLLHYLGIINTVTSILALRSGKEEHLQKKEELWQYLKEKAPKIYKRLRRSMLGCLVYLPGRGGRRVSVELYKLVQRIYGFN